MQPILRNFSVLNRASYTHFFTESPPWWPRLQLEIFIVYIGVIAGEVLIVLGNVPFKLEVFYPVYQIPVPPAAFTQSSNAKTVPLAHGAIDSMSVGDCPRGTEPAGLAADG
ncbi:hypothetical protein B0H14DRAFT_2586263 [Mycena olivaceomarginata]|nr:hypothetical protein B0H14DRAFT_2586263 [Mycena olivaceomarginata]